MNMYKHALSKSVQENKESFFLANCFLVLSYSIGGEIIQHVNTKILSKVVGDTSKPKASMPYLHSFLVYLEYLKGNMKDKPILKRNDIDEMKFVSKFSTVEYKKFIKHLRMQHEPDYNTYMVSVRYLKVLYNSLGIKDSYCQSVLRDLQQYKSFNYKQIIGLTKKISHLLATTIHSSDEAVLANSLDKFMKDFGVEMDRREAEAKRNAKQNIQSPNIQHAPQPVDNVHNDGNLAMDLLKFGGLMAAAWGIHKGAQKVRQSGLYKTPYKDNPLPHRGGDDM